jgi:hypothetical protein
MSLTVVADSVVSLSLPWGGGLDIPASSFWGAVGQLISGVILALLVWWLARGRIRTERWQERQIEAYHEVVRALYTIQEYTGPHAEEEEREERGDPRVRSTEQLEAHRAEVDAAIRIVRRQAAVGPFLLKPKAVAILRTYEDRLHDEDWTGSHFPKQSWNWLARECWSEFANRARYDLGQIGFMSYWIRVGSRWPTKARRWFMGRPRSQLDHRVWELKQWWENRRNTPDERSP